MKTPTKIYHKDIFMFTKQDGNYRWELAATRLPLAIAYGASVNSSKGVLLFGGEQVLANGNIVNSNNMQLLALQQQRLTITELGHMPFTFAKGASAYYQGKVYFLGGMQNGIPSNQVSVYDIDKNIWHTLAPYPGAARVNLVATVSTDHQNRPTLFLFSGSSVTGNKNTVQTDGWALTLNASSSESKWRPTPSIAVNGGEKISLLGSSNIKISANETLFLGGYNKQVFDWWLDTYQRVAGRKQEKQAKNRFFFATAQSI